MSQTTRTQVYRQASRIGSLVCLLGIVTVAEIAGAAPPWPISTWNRWARRHGVFWSDGYHVGNPEPPYYVVPGGHLSVPHVPHVPHVPDTRPHGPELNRETFGPDTQRPAPAIPPVPATPPKGELPAPSHLRSLNGPDGTQLPPRQDRSVLFRSPRQSS